MIAIAATVMVFAACGNNGSNAKSDKKSNDTIAEVTPKQNNDAPAEVAYEQFTIEKYNVTFDILKGMRRTDDPSSDNGGAWTLVPENDNDSPINAAVQIGVYESWFGDYDDERIQRAFDEDIPEEAEKKLDLEKKEYSYSVGEEYKEFHRVIFKDNLQIEVLVVYTDRWEPKLGGEVRDHILNSAKFN